MRERMLAEIDALRDWSFALLAELVGLNSFTANKAGCDACLEILARECAALPGAVLTRIPQARAGDHLLVRLHPGAGDPALLVGHFDTVFSPEFCAVHHFTGLTEQPDGTLRGPGVIDMKGGLVTLLTAVRALLALDEKPPLTLVFNSDEETGSATSAGLISEQARQSRFGLVFECAGMHGETATGRKGKTTYDIHVHGAAGHASLLGAVKPSAILELSRKIVRLEGLNGTIDGATVNVGTVSGGTVPNSVPRDATARVDTRYVSEASGRDLAEAIAEIIARDETPGTHSRLTPLTSRPAMAQTETNMALYALAKHHADSLGHPMIPELRSGVSDANQIAAAGIPVLDGLGPMGEKDHSEHEYMLPDSLTPRALISALTILDGLARL